MSLSDARSRVLDRENPHECHTDTRKRACTCVCTRTPPTHRTALQQKHDKQSPATRASAPAAAQARADSALMPPSTMIQLPPCSPPAREGPRRPTSCPSFPSTAPWHTTSVAFRHDTLGPRAPAEFSSGQVDAFSLFPPRQDSYSQVRCTWRERCAWRASGDSRGDPRQWARSASGAGKFWTSLSC